MGSFKKSTNITGKYKAVSIVNGSFVDFETGEEIDIIAQLGNVYGTEPFSITTSNKVDIDLD